MAEPLLTIDFWNVGQGDCSVIKLPDGSLILIDVGPKQSPVIDWLREPQQIRSRIHSVIITHNDSDHAGALPSLLSQRESGVGSLFMLQDRPKSDPGFDRLFRLATELEKKGLLKLIRLESSLPPVWSDPKIQTKLVVRHPDFAAAVKMRSPNSISGILELNVMGSAVAVWPGDVRFSQVTELYRTLNAQVLVGPHHGAPQDFKKSTPKIDLKAAAEVGEVYVSVGTNNGYHHPYKRYINELRNRSISVRCSQITLQCDRRVKTSGFSVLDGNSMIGLPEPATGVSCRGGMRMKLKDGRLQPDRWQQEHSRLIGELQRPMCISHCKSG